MAGQQTTTDAAVMAQFAGRAEDVSQSLTASISSLMNNLSTLQSTWLGLGGTAFTATTQTVSEETKKLNQALLGISADINTAATNYTGSDEQQQSQMNTVNSQTSGITAGLTGV